MLTKRLHFLHLGLVTSVLVACGGGGGGDSSPGNPGEVLTGVFLDSVVAGVEYKTASQSGFTSAAGEFNYRQGETVSFSIGDLMLGSTTASSVVTPVSLVPGATDVGDPAVINIVRLLLSLDADEDPDNGIDISADVRTKSKDQQLQFDSAGFDTEAEQVLAAVKGAGAVLVAADQAQAHFNASLSTHWGTMVWGEDCWALECTGVKKKVAIGIKEAVKL